MKISGVDTQDPLVSGTNIKTINSNSILGSGDLTISSGGGGIHIPLPPVSGRIYGLRITALGLNTSSTLADWIRLVPFFPKNSITAASLSINVSAASAGSRVKILAFNDLAGVPDAKLFESADLDCGTTGVKTANSPGLTFDAGGTYYLGIVANAVGPTLTAYSANSLLPVSEAAVASVANVFLSTASYTFNSIPNRVNGGSWFPVNANTPGVFITAA